MDNYPSNKLYDVVVIGAGPAGNFAAITMAEKGLDVAVFDSREEIGNKLCTGIIGEDCVSLFPPNCDVIHRKISSAKLHSPKGNPYSIEEGVFSAWVLDRRAYIKDMSIQAEGLGVCYLIGDRVTEVDIRNDWVLVRTSKRITVRARGILICSGFGTNIAEYAGLTSPSNRKFLQGSQALVRMSEQDYVEVFIEGQECPGAFSWLVPTYDDYGLLGAIYKPNDVNPMSRHFSEMNMEKGNFEKIGKVENWGIPIGPVSKTFEDRVLLAGDAAGFTKPTTGGGIFYAMISGQLAAMTMVEAAVANDFSSEFLERYQDRWAHEFGDELVVGMIARDLMEMLDDKILEQLINKFTADIQMDLMRHGSLSFDWHSQSIFQTLKNRYVLDLLTSLGPSIAVLVAKMLTFKIRNIVNL